MKVDKSFLYRTQFALEFRKHGDVARAHDAANRAVERAEEADRRRHAAMKPVAKEERPSFPDDEQLADLIDPRRCAAWDRRLLNVFLAEHHQENDPSDDPRLELVALTEQLSRDSGLKFAEALDVVKFTRPELIQRVADYNATL